MQTKVFCLLMLSMALGVPVFAQPTFLPASGCMQSGVLTTEMAKTVIGVFPIGGAGTQERTILPGDTDVVIGAWLFLDDLVFAPMAQATANCPAAGNDALPTFVTRIRVFAPEASGDPAALGIKQVKFWLDNNHDGFLQPGLDTQLSLPMPGACLSQPNGCELSYGNTPLLNSVLGLPDRVPLPIPFLNIGLGVTVLALLVTVDVDQPSPGATFQVMVEAQASDIINNAVSRFSSDFSPNFRRMASSIRVTAESWPDHLSAPINNGRGLAETFIKSVAIEGIRTRNDRDPGDRDAHSGDREYVVGLIALCEGGVPSGERVTMLPFLASATPAIAGGLGAVPCAPFGSVPTFGPTNLLRIRIGVQGAGAQWVQAVRFYADLSAPATPPTGWVLPGPPALAPLIPATLAGTLAGSLFERGELVFGQLLENGYAAFGSLEQGLRTSAGVPLSCNSLSFLGTPPCLLYFTFDIDPLAVSSDVTVWVALDTGDIQNRGGPGGGILPSTRVISPELQRFEVHIAGPVSGAVAPAGVEAIHKTRLENHITWQADYQGVRLLLSEFGVERAQVEVFDLAGQLLFDSGMALPGALRWDLLNRHGQRVPNGVYLYVVRVVGANGQLVSKVSKLAIVK